MLDTAIMTLTECKCLHKSHKYFLNRTDNEWVLKNDHMFCI